MSFSRYSKIFCVVRKVAWCKEVERQITRPLSTSMSRCSCPVQKDGPVNNSQLEKESSIISESCIKNSNVAQESKPNDRLETPNSTLSIAENRNADIDRINIISPRTFGRMEATDYLYDEPINILGPLDKCTKDISDMAPYLSPTFNFAAYANKSYTIQRLVDLGVKLYKFEKEEDTMKFLLGLDFNRDIKPYIIFLHDYGVSANILGEFLSVNPLILKEDMDDLRMRIKYLSVHSFDKDMITRIICENPKWLSYNIKEIDGRLGYFQTEFHLTGNEVRRLTVKRPTLITSKMTIIQGNTFAIREEMGFDNYETKALILSKPGLWTRNRTAIVERFDYAHNVMKLPHKLLLKQPDILLCRLSRIKQRHEFLVTLNRAQYDPEQPLYIAPKTLITGTDVDFCRTVAKVAVETYNMYLKTL